ncbi:hypothetical protein JL720_4772 [Aureococcus anophagefferens]|nr:hypothetical protein JL720_4772 [Aureococcus anophagefferens]
MTRFANCDEFVELVRRAPSAARRRAPPSTREVEQFKSWDKFKSMLAAINPIGAWRGDVAPARRARARPFRFRARGALRRRSRPRAPRYWEAKVAERTEYVADRLARKRKQVADDEAPPRKPRRGEPRANACKAALTPEAAPPRLGPGEWLVDEVVNYYFAMLQQRDAALVADEGEKPSHFFNSFFIPKLMGTDAPVRTTDDTPRQLNGYDCGVFATFARTTSAPLDFSQADIPTSATAMIDILDALLRDRSHQPGTRVGAPLQERILFKFEIHGLK